MTQQQNKKIVDDVNKELEQGKLEKIKREVRVYKQEQLEQQEFWKSKKEEAEENLRKIKLNIENLDSGDLAAIDERMRKTEGKCFNLLTSAGQRYDPSWARGTYIFTYLGKTYKFYF